MPFHVGGAIGKGIREFRKAQCGIEELAKPLDSAPQQAQEGERVS